MSEPRPQDNPSRRLPKDGRGTEAEFTLRYGA